jgi:hypothetical protein
MGFVAHRAITQLNFSSWRFCFTGIQLDIQQVKIWLPTKEEGNWIMARGTITQPPWLT